MSHDYQEKIAKFYWANPELVKLAVDTSLGTKKDWAKVPVNMMDMFLMDGDKVFVKVADQMTGEYRAVMNAIIMLGQVKIIIQAEIDAADELVDFLSVGEYEFRNRQGILRDDKEVSVSVVSLPIDMLGMYYIIN